MRRFFILITVLLLILGGTGVAGAMYYEIGDDNSFDLGSGWVGQGDNYTTHAHFGHHPDLSDVSFTLGVGDSRTFRYGGVKFHDENILESNEVDNLEIVAYLDFDLPTGAGIVGSTGSAVTVLGWVDDKFASHQERSDVKLWHRHSNLGWHWHWQPSGSKGWRKINGVRTWGIWYGHWYTVIDDGHFNHNDNKIGDLGIRFSDTIVYLGDGASFKLAMSGVKFTDWDTQPIRATVTHLSDPDPIPEPATFLLLGTGILGFAFVSRKKFKR